MMHIRTAAIDVVIDVVSNKVFSINFFFFHPLLRDFIFFFRILFL